MEQLRWRWRANQKKAAMWCSCLYKPDLPRCFGGAAKLFQAPKPE